MSATVAYVNVSIRDEHIRRKEGCYIHIYANTTHSGRFPALSSFAFNPKIDAKVDRGSYEIW